MAYDPSNEPVGPEEVKEMLLIVGDAYNQGVNDHIRTAIMALPEEQAAEVWEEIDDEVLEVICDIAGNKSFEYLLLLLGQNNPEMLVALLTFLRTHYHSTGALS